MEWMLMPFRRYADFSGRSRRMEYWMFRLFEFGVFMVGLIAMSILAATAGSAAGETAGSIVGSIGVLGLVMFALFSFIPGLAVTVRRLHDTDKSGWMILIGLIPLIGGILLLIFLFSDGTRGANKYGADPKGEGYSGDVFA